MLHRLVSSTLAVVLCVGCALPVSAEEANETAICTIDSQENYLPYNGEEFSVTTVEEEASTYSDIAIYYKHNYTPGPTYYGGWRSGVSGGSSITDMTLTFDRAYDHTYDISFTANVTGNIH